MQETAQPHTTPDQVVLKFLHPVPHHVWCRGTSPSPPPPARQRDYSQRCQQGYQCQRLQQAAALVLVLAAAAAAIAAGGVRWC